ncbi:Retrovirus-related Pol polyprotein from type-2 retrotransposable element R2DM [Trichinella spiralis]|uniref:Retrovirus-related Pol polyprotein from type-2 retrotransposable element R2DM n=1 Tax=Trichinella spiralis TaxID=6334 RepID=A0A0V1ASH2_TRISP|nr:Retrovirus-related Pol polyprotein from type-2 retrotransposable element R2DM [Trichinella spiralis]
MNLGSASGPDGVKVSNLREIGPTVSLRHIPQILQDCRTAVIPKVDNPRSDAEDFRSITIGFCMYRLFSKIVTNPLSELTPLNPCQKAFHSGTDGAFDNVSNVASLLELFRRTGKEINVACIDLAYGFDTINHTSITRALCRHGVDFGSIEHVESMIGSLSAICSAFTYKHPANSKNILSPIFLEEVTLHLQKMKVKTSAGADLMQVSHLRTCDPVCLTKASNLFLLTRCIPQQLKDCRTTLIPKTDSPHPDAEDYRPITVASCLYRLFSKIAMRQLENSFSLHPRQKALPSGTDGAFDNTEAHKRGKGLNIVSIDLAKALDTVNHSSIDGAPCMQGLDVDSRNLIAQMVTGSSTIIKGDGGALSNRIEINQGVRQGDPISPLLFNSVMDELIERLEQSGVGFKLKGVEVITLAFADDVTLISRSHRGMEKLLSITLDFLNERDLKLNVNKCKGIRLIRTPKTKSLVEDTSKAVNHSNGIPHFDLASFGGTLERIRKAPPPQTRTETCHCAGLSDSITGIQTGSPRDI